MVRLNFPETFGDYQFFIDYPYFLPCTGGVVGFITRGKTKPDTRGEGDDRDFVIKYATEGPSINILNNSDANNDTDAFPTNLKPHLTLSASDDGDSLSMHERDLERQPLMPLNELQPQYGSMATLAKPMRRFETVSARSNLSRRTAPSRPSDVRSTRQHLTGDNLSKRPRTAAGQHSIYAYSRPLSAGGLLSMIDPMESIPADAQSLNFYGYTDSFLENGSHVFLLTPNPTNKDPNAPMQVLVVQTEVGLSSLSITTIAAYAMLALHSIVFEEVYPLYAVTPLTSYGLGWNAMQLSTSRASMGFVQLLLQFVLYPKLEPRFSALWLFRSFLTDENEPETGGQISGVRNTVLLVLVSKYVCSVLSYTSVMVMITNSSPPQLLGTVNGIGQTSASFMRALGPALGGILWAWSLGNKLSLPFNYFFVFFLMGTIAILGLFHSLSIPQVLAKSEYEEALVVREVHEQRKVRRTTIE
ncbi:MAG: hypothetical protein BYD32DRAFT_407906 [Podila humilis]|nr:MAG: hypothetical protein BYD32DRAFT_407906 [Podila humilis]